MRTTIIILSILAVVFAEEQEEVCFHVTDVDSTNMTEQIVKHHMTVMLFFAKWCGHCRSLMPDYDLMCKDVHENMEGSVLCARMDCAVNEKLCNENHLTAYPTVKAIHANFVCEYKGQRTRGDIYGWIRSVYYSTVDLTNVETLRKIMAGNYVVVAYFVADHPHRAMGQKLTCDLPSLTYASISDPSLASELKIETLNSFNIFENGELKSVIEHIEDEKDLLKRVFVMTNALVPDYTHETSSSIFSSELRYYLAFLYDSVELLEGNKAVLEQFAKSKIPEVRVFTIDASELSNKNVVDYLQVTTFPFFAFYDDAEQKFYHFTGDSFSVETLHEFVSGCQTGSVSPYIKRQPIPENWDEGPVKHLVYDNFETVFEKYGQGTVLFYAPWCGHCSAFMPSWEELAANLAKDHPSLFAATLDHTKNELDGIEIKGYPTIMAFKSRHEFVTFDGERSLEAVYKFVVDYLVPSAETGAKEQPTEKDMHEEL